MINLKSPISDFRFCSAARIRSHGSQHQWRKESREFGSGFTLVEVLAALMLLAIVLPVAMRGISMATALASSAKHRDEAAVLAKSKLDELVATHAWQSQALSGNFDFRPEYRWSAA